jgi:hypothetical protein
MKCCKINEIDEENPQSWVDVGSEYCTNLDCRHKRCCNCYYLDCEWQPVQYCDGRAVDPERYEEWYSDFGMLMLPVDNSRLEADVNRAHLTGISKAGERCFRE